MVFIFVLVRSKYQIDKILRDVEISPFVNLLTYRRQDMRALNSKNRRNTDRKLILFLVITGLTFLSLGTAMVVLYTRYHLDNKDVRPCIVIGKNTFNHLFVSE